MKTTFWKPALLSVLIAASCAVLGLMKTLAQNETEITPEAGPATLSTAKDATPPSPPQPPSAPGEANAAEASDRWERGAKFRAEFDQQRKGPHRSAIVVFGKNAELKTNETAEAVVVIGGSAIVHGKVKDAVVAIGGDVNLDGAEVGEAAVSVLGSVKLGPGSIVHGDVVSVGGTTEVSDGATVDGQIQPVEFGAFGLPKLDWLKHWFVECVFKLRPLALAPEVGWVWIVAGALFGLNLLIAVALAKPVENCVTELTGRPATTFLMGLLSTLLVPLILMILIATGLGVFAVPFVLAVVFFGAAIGKVGFLEYLGFALARAFGGGTAVKPLPAFLIGSVILTLLYLVPVLGLLTLCVTGMWGLGGAVMAIFGGAKRELPQRSSPPPAVPLPNPMTATTAGVVTFTPDSSAPTGQTTHGPAATEASFQPPAVASSDPVTTPEALAFPRANFWERLGAAFLDVILVSILGHFVGGPPLGLLVALAYFAGMWTWRGTTVGGIVLNLKVVRLDAKPVTFPVALVRGLAAAFSAIVLFLGFFWIIFDREKQSWHDKIAGTVVIRLPRGSPLVCL